MMRDHLLHNATPDETDARVLPVIAYTDLGSPGSTDEAGNVLTEGTPPTAADGVWHIYSDDTIPAELAPFVVASGDRGAGLRLPAGIAGLSTIWAGMTLLPPTP
jgi:hypothetical protein